MACKFKKKYSAKKADYSKKPKKLLTAQERLDEFHKEAKAMDGLRTRSGLTHFKQREIDLKICKSQSLVDHHRA